jgi:hypothetical protein
MSQFQEAQDAIDESKRVAALEVDANRYRKLRDSGQVYPKDGPDDHGWLPAFGDDVDEFVDGIKEKTK